MLEVFLYRVYQSTKHVHAVSPLVAYQHLCGIHVILQVDLEMP